MLETIEFLEEEKEYIQDMIVEYATKGNSFGVATSNEKLKYINSLITKANEKLNSDDSVDA